MVNKVKASIELTLLVLVMSLFIIGIGVFGVLEIRKLNDNTKELYADRMLPMDYLGDIRFYSSTLLSTTCQADKNQVPYTEALKKINRAQDSIKANWNKYLRTYLTPDEKRLAAKTGIIIAQTDNAIEKTKSALSKHDGASLSVVLKNELQPGFNSVVDQVSQLLSFQIRSAQKINQKNTKVYDTYTRQFLWILLIAFVLILPFLYYLVKKNRIIISRFNVNNAKLFLTEENYRNLIEYAGEAILILNEATEIIDVNSYACDLLGYSREELLAMKISAFVAPEDLKKQMADINRIKKEKSATLYRSVRKKNGTFIETEISNRLMEGKGFFAIIRDITGRKKAESELRQSEEKYHSLVEHAGDAIFVVDAERNIIEVNSSACELLGYTREELQGMNAVDVYPPNDLSIEPIQWGILQKERTLLNETKLQRKDGTIVEVEVNRKLLNDDSYLAIVRDITKRKKIEEELIESKEQLRLFIEHSPASLAMFDNQMRYLATSRRWIIDYNLAAQDIIGKTHYEVFPEIGQEWKEIHQRCLKGAVEKREEDSFLREDGSLEWLKWEIRPWHRATGEIGGIVMFTEVITKRKKATEMFQRQFENSPDIILYVNKYFKIEAINRSQPGGRPIEALLGMDCIAILPKQSQAIARAALDNCFETGENQEIENALSLDRWVRSRMVPIITNGEVTHVMIFGTDITESKKAENELIRYNAELKKTNAELDRFVYSASHDLRAPLKSMLGLINITSEDIKENGVPDGGLLIAERLKMLNKSAAKLDNFIEDILNYSRNARMELTYAEIDFEELVNEVRTNLKFTEEQKIDFKVSILTTEKFISDANRLTVVLNNVISNACKYSDPAKENPFINVTFACDKNKATITIEDNGIGIAEKGREKIFDMFYRSTTMSTGSGLGLYIVKETMDRLNGTISVASTLGKGSKFCIEIPNQLNL